MNIQTVGNLLMLLGAVYTAQPRVNADPASAPLQPAESRAKSFCQA
jgi:hypothetical protein